MTTPTTSRVSKEMRAIAAQARNKEYTRARQAGEPRNEDREFLAALDAALASLGDVVAVSELESLITFHCGMMVKEENEDIVSGAATVIADLSAILNRGGK